MQAAMQQGDFIDTRFEIEAQAGAGGMGMVYRARDRETGELVAIKLLHNAGAGHTARFMREIHALSSVVHEHVVQYVTHGVTDADEPYLVMEWLEGESLDDRLAREPLGLAAALELARRVAEALGAAHARGIVHRDIKPSNLFLVDGDVARVKVLDFGIAQLAEDTLPLTLTNQVLGTAGYMAPEQARGEQARVDPRSDVFSLGCVLFECLTGRPAFQGAHLMALLAKLLLDEAPRVRALAPGVPEAVDALVARMLDKNPTVRPAHGVAAARALAELAGAPVVAGADEPVTAPCARAAQRAASAVTASAPGRTPRERSSVGAATTVVLGDAGSEPSSNQRRAARSRARVEEPVGGRVARPVSRRAGAGPRPVGAQDAPALAAHFGQGDEDAPAAPSHDRAALRALREPALAAAGTHVQRGLARGPDARARGGLHAMHAAACFWRADHAASYASARQALDLAASGTQAHWLALSMAIVSAGHAGRHEAFASLVASLLEADPGPDPGTSAELDRVMLDAFWGAFAALVASGRVTDAAICLRRLERIVTPRRAREPFAAACLEAAYTYWHRYVERAPWAALGHGRATLALCEQAGAPGARDLQQALIVACELMELGAFAQAEEIVTRWSRAGEPPGVAGSWATYARAMVHACMDRLDEALTIATAAEAQARARSDRVLAVRLRYIIIHCSLQRGDVHEAEQMLLGLGEPGTLRVVDRPEFFATQARIRLAQGRHDEAMGLAGEALAADSAAMIGTYALRDTCRLVRAEALHAMGEVAAARHAIRAAHDDLQARASGIGDPACRLRFLRDVPLHARVLALARDWLGHAPD